MQLKCKRPTFPADRIVKPFPITLLSVKLMVGRVIKVIYLILYLLICWRWVLFACFHASSSANMLVGLDFQVCQQFSVKWMKSMASGSPWWFITCLCQPLVTSSAE